ncbi:MAG TPA: O-antigen ligase family protein [Blastocatellia bacterium]|nr:O-antigen ligase family protein [Blastocatellia bacterium]
MSSLAPPAPTFSLDRFWRKTALLEKSIYVALLLLLVLTPIPYGTVEIWSTAVWEIAIFAIMLLWGVRAVKEQQLQIVLSPLIWPMLALLLFVIAQFLPIASGERPTISYDAYATTQAAIKILAFLCLLLLFPTFVNTDPRRDTVLKLIIALCVLIALVGIGQSYISKTLWPRASFGPFVNRNHFAGFLELGIGLAGGMVIGRSLRFEEAAVYFSCALAMIAGVVLSASRGGVMAVAVEVVFLAIVAIPGLISGRLQKRPGWLMLGLRFAGVLVLGLSSIWISIYLVGSEALVQNVSQVQSEIEQQQPAGERYSRREIWAATRRMIQDHPLLGVGLGAYPVAYTRYDQSSGSQRVEQSHNDYLQIVADAGLVGGLIALTFLVVLFRQGFLAAQTRDRRRRSVILGALAGCFAMAVHSFVEFNLQITANAQLFLVLALLATQARSPAGQKGVEEAQPARSQAEPVG